MRLQLKKRYPSLSQGLSAASCALLGTSSQAADMLDDWQTDAAVLIYSEQGRVQVIEPTMIARRAIGDDDALTVQLIYDSMSGATPTGAAPANFRQTYTTPSCGSSYSIDANTTPKREFTDVRGSLTLGWDSTLNRQLRTQLGAHISGETDYASLGVNGSALMDFNNKNTTLTLSLAYDGDHVAPVAGRPEALTSSMTACGLISRTAFSNALYPPCLR